MHDGNFNIPAGGLRLFLSLAVYEALFLSKKLDLQIPNMKSKIISLSKVE